MKVLKIVEIALLVLAAIVGALFLYMRYRMNNVKDNGDLESTIGGQIQKTLTGTRPRDG